MTSSPLHTLRVPLVGSLAATGRAALGTTPAASTTLLVHARAAAAATTTTTTTTAAAASTTAIAATTAAATTTRPNSRAGESEGLDAVVDAHGSVGVVVPVRTRELDHGTGAAAATVLDLDLNARDVVLGLLDVRSVNTYIDKELA